jgi:uncharacterized protein YbjT (DUF2867 family)
MIQTKILISGATGNVGTQLVNRLAALNTPFKALVRNSDNIELLKSLPQAEIIIGDLADETKLINAMQGIEKAFLLTNSSEHAEKLQSNFVHAAHRSGVKHLVKLSQFAANENSPVRFLRYHARVEHKIKELGLSYTFLRPNLYMQGLIALKDYIKNDGKFYASVGNAAISAVDIRDIATVAAKALTETGHEDKIYNITGKEAITHYQMADTFSRVLGRKIMFIDVTPDQMEEALKAAGFPEWQLKGLIEDYAHYARGEAAEIYNTVSDLTNIAPAGFEQFVNDHKELFN